MGQFQDLYSKIEKQVENITLLVKERIRDARNHLEDARREGQDMVQVAEPKLVPVEETERADQAQQRGRGMER